MPTLFWLKALPVPETADPCYADASRGILRVRIGAGCDQLLAMREPRQPRRMPSERLPHDAR